MGRIAGLDAPVPVDGDLRDLSIDRVGRAIGCIWPEVVEGDRLCSAGRLYFPGDNAFLTANGVDGRILLTVVSQALARRGLLIGFWRLTSHHQTSKEHCCDFAMDSVQTTHLPASETGINYANRRIPHAPLNAILYVS